MTANKNIVTQDKTMKQVMDMLWITKTVCSSVKSKTFPSIQATLNELNEDAEFSRYYNKYKFEMFYELFESKAIRIDNTMYIITTLPNEEVYLIVATIKS